MPPRDMPYRDRKNGAKTRHGVKAETKLTRRIGGRGTIGSGAFDREKADAVVKHFRVENKTTINQSLSLKLEWLRKINRQAVETSRRPALTIQFVDAAGDSDPRDRWVMIPEIDFIEVLGELPDERE